MASAKSATYLQNMEEVQKVFNRFDANGDNRISADELAGVLKALGSDSSPDEVARMMDEIDTDKDGHINLEEFAAFCAGGGDDPDGSGGSAEEELKEAFAMYDQDRNGKISTAELHQILTRLGERCTVEDCEGMIRSVDSDGDGCVDFEEFKTMMTKSNV